MLKFFYFFLPIPDQTPKLILLKFCYQFLIPMTMIWNLNILQTLFMMLKKRFWTIPFKKKINTYGIIQNHFFNNMNCVWKMFKFLSNVIGTKDYKQHFCSVNFWFLKASKIIALNSKIDKQSYSKNNVFFLPQILDQNPRSTLLKFRYQSLILMTMLQNLNILHTPFMFVREMILKNKYGIIQNHFFDNMNCVLRMFKVWKIVIGIKE